MAISTDPNRDLQKGEEHIYPRVLVINGEPFWQGSATGLTMTKLFKGWPMEKLACLYISRSAPDWTICERYWKLELLDLSCVRNIIGKRSSKKHALLKLKDVGYDSYYKKTYLYLKAMAICKKMRRYLAGTSMRELDVYEIPEYIIEQICHFQPQVIYSMLAFNRVLKLALDISDFFSIPIVPHFMDDWPTTLYQSSIFRSTLRKQMHDRLNAVLDRSPKRMVIGDAMTEEYTRRYGGEFLPFMNAVEPELMGPIVPPKTRKKVRLIYIGGLHLNRWCPLRDIGMCLKELHNDALEVEAIVFSLLGFDDQSHQLNIPPVMRFAGALDPFEVPKALRDSDILIHVESFDHTDRVYTRYSVSTKIPECMSAARPILAYGPEELASIKYVRDSGAGLVVGHQDRTLLTSAIRELAMSKPLRERLGSQGYQTALKRHNAALQRDFFRSILNECAIHDKR